MKLVSALIFLAALVTPVSAFDTGRLQGTLHDSETSQPIAEATVRIIALNVDYEFNAVTDDKGRFAHVGLRQGTYLITVTKDGYAPVDVFDVVIFRDEPTRLKLTMTPSERSLFKRHLIRYRRPLLNTEDASLKFVFRMGVY